MANPKPAEQRKPDGVGVHQMVVCIDGPRASAWYFEDYGSCSWNTALRIAREYNPGPDSTYLGYVDSGKTVPHPRWPDVRGKALIWRPESGGGS